MDKRREIHRLVCGNCLEEEREVAVGKANVTEGVVSWTSKEESGSRGREIDRVNPDSGSSKMESEGTVRFPKADVIMTLQEQFTGVMWMGVRPERV